MNWRRNLKHLAKWMLVCFGMMWLAFIVMLLIAK